MASNEGPANNAGNEAGANRLPAVPPTSPASDSRVTNGRPDNAPTTSSSESDINTNSEPTSASHRPLLPGFLNVQDEHQDMTIDLQTGVATYQPLTGRDRHRDPLCDLPHLVDRQDIESQRILYAFLLLAGPGDWGNTVQLYNYLFHRTSDVVTHDGQLVTPAPPIPAMATEASIKAMLEQQDLYPIDKEGLFEYMDKLTALNKPFIGQGRQQGMRYELDEVIDMLRDWIEEAGVLIVVYAFQGSRHGQRRARIVPLGVKDHKGRTIVRDDFVFRRRILGDRLTLSRVKMLVISWKCIAATCWVFITLPACHGSSLSNLATDPGHLHKRASYVLELNRLDSNLTVPGPTNTADNIIDFRPRRPGSPWPAEIIVPGIYPFTIKIQDVESLTDEGQIRDIETALTQVTDTVCTDGYRLYRAVQPHTLSEQAVSCLDIGTRMVVQRSLLSGAMLALLKGQTVHGPAAVSGEVWHREHMIKYGAISARVGKPPSAPWQVWPIGTLHLPVPGPPGLRLEIETFGHPLDNWDTKWFIELCEQVIQMLRSQQPNEPVAPIEQILDPQRDGVKFYPIVTAGTSPLTNRMLIAVMRTMNHDVFARYGARESRFVILDAQGRNLLGWGLFGLYVLPGWLGSGRNSTILSTSFDEANGTSNGSAASVAIS